MNISEVSGENYFSTEISVRTKPKLNIDILEKELTNMWLKPCVIQEMIKGGYELACAIRTMPQYVTRLLSWDIDLEARDPSGRTPLHVAIEINDLCTHRFVTQLLAEGADIKAKNSITGDSVLHYASRAGNLNLLALGILRNVDLFENNSKGQTAMHAAAESSEDVTDIINILHKKGLDVNQQDLEGKTPLYFAAALGRINNIRTLLSLGADVHQGTSILEIAILNNHSDIVKLLIKHGAI